MSMNCDIKTSEILNILDVENSELILNKTVSISVIISKLMIIKS